MQSRPEIGRGRFPGAPARVFISVNVLICIDKKICHPRLRIQSCELNLKIMTTVEYVYTLSLCIGLCIRLDYYQYRGETYLNHNFSTSRLPPKTLVMMANKPKIVMK